MNLASFKDKPKNDMKNRKRGIEERKKGRSSIVSEEFEQSMNNEMGNHIEIMAKT